MREMDRTTMREALWRDPERLVPTERQVHLAWHWISRRYWAPGAKADYHVGMYVAAEWTCRLSDIPPFSGAHGVSWPKETAHPHDHGRVGDELDIAAALSKGEHPGHGVPEQFLWGAMAWLLWWVGAGEYPVWLPAEEAKSA